MQDYPLRSDRLRVDLIHGAVLATFAAVISWFVGMVLMGPVAVAVALMTALPIKASLAITAGGLAAFPALMTTLLWRVARRHPPVDHVVRVAICGCVVGSFIGQAVVWFILSGAVLPPS